MENYNFWADILDTYQSSSEIIKALWFIVPAVFVLALFALVLHHRVALKQAESSAGSDVVYVIHHDEFDQPQVSRHGGETGQKPTVLILDQPDGETAEPQIPNGLPLEYRKSPSPDIRHKKHRRLKL